MVEFGIYVELVDETADKRCLREVCRAAEEGGFDVFWVDDHYCYPQASVILEAWAAMAALACWTERMRIGTMVTPIPLRHPSVLAKLVSTVDILSEGRVNFGVGAGWVQREYESFGIGWEDFKTRIDRTREGLGMILRLFQEPSVSHEGRFHRLRDAQLYPKPVQKPHPPVWVGGNGRAIMRLTGEMGDGWIPWNRTVTELTEGADAIRGYARRFGRPEAKISLAHATHAEIAETRERAFQSLPSGHKELAEKRRMVAGSPRDAVELVEEYLTVGIDHFAVEFPHDPERRLEQVRLFSAAVIPSFR